MQNRKRRCAFGDKYMKLKKRRFTVVVTPSKLEQETILCPSRKLPFFFPQHLSFALWEFYFAREKNILPSDFALSFLPRTFFASHLPKKKIFFFCRTNFCFGKMTMPRKCNQKCHFLFSEAIFNCSSEMISLCGDKSCWLKHILLSASLLLRCHFYQTCFSFIGSKQYSLQKKNGGFKWSTAEV